MPSFLVVLALYPVTGEICSVGRQAILANRTVVVVVQRGDRPTGQVGGAESFGGAGQEGEDALKEDGRAGHGQPVLRAMPSRDWTQQRWVVARQEGCGHPLALNPAAQPPPLQER